MPVLTPTNWIVLSNGESTSGWSGDTFNLESDIKVQGSNSVSCQQTSNGANTVRYTQSIINPVLTGKTLRLAVNFTYIGNISTSNPFTLTVSTTQGTDSLNLTPPGGIYTGGWIDLVVDCNLLSNASGDLLWIEFTTNCTSKPKTGSRGYFDNWRLIDGVSVTSDGGTAFDFENVAADDDTDKHGVVQLIDGVNFVSGKLGIDNATAAVNFNSSNETLFFPTRTVRLSLYELNIQPTQASSDVVISGLVAKTVSSTLSAEFNLLGNYNTLSLTSSTFINLGLMDFQPSATTVTFDGNSFTDCDETTLALSATNCTWKNSGTIDVISGGELTNCSFTGFGSGSVDQVTTANIALLSGCQFDLGTGSNIQNGVRVTLSGDASEQWDHTITTPAWVGSAGNFDASNTSSVTGAALVVAGTGKLTLSIAAGATIPLVKCISPATCEITAGQVTLTITGVPAGGEWRVYDKSVTQGLIGTELAGEESSAGGNKTYSYTYSADNPAVLQVFAAGYEEFTRTFTLGANDQTQNADLILEENT